MRYPDQGRTETMGTVIEIIAFVVLGVGIFVTRYAIIEAVRDLGRGKRY
jgi:nitrate reductase NapE component